MKSTTVDKDGNVTCPVCGAKNQFNLKRTGKAKWAGAATLGVGVAVMPKRAKCLGCGTNLKMSGGGKQATTPGPKPKQGPSLFDQ